MNAADMPRTGEQHSRASGRSLARAHRMEEDMALEGKEKAGARQRAAKPDAGRD